MTLEQRVKGVLQAVGADVKMLRTWVTGASSGTLAGLQTNDKTSLVAAINELALHYANSSGNVQDWVSATDFASQIDAITTLIAAEQTRASGVEEVKADLVSGKVPTSQLPAIVFITRVPVADQTAMLELTTDQVQPGDLAVLGDGSGSFMLVGDDPSDLDNWGMIDGRIDAVTSINGQLGVVVLGAHDVGTLTSAEIADLSNAQVPKALVNAKGDILVGTADDTVARKAVGADGRRLQADSTQDDGLIWADITPQVTQYTVPVAGVVYNAPKGAKRFKFRVQGAGAGGGSGRRGPAGAVRTGGSGGTAGGYSEWEVSAADIGGDTLLVKVGAGTAGGAAQTVDSTDGSNAANGGNSYVRTAANVDLCVASGGRGGRAGSIAAASASAGVFGKFSSADSGNSSGAGGTGIGGGSSTAGGSGGAGGGVTVANVGSTGGVGGFSNGITSVPAPQGGTTGLDGENGINPAAAILGAGYGGAGGGGNPAGPGGNGGNGGRGAGGGGGGASVNGNASGAGGSGGDGFVEIVAYF